MNSKSYEVVKEMGFAENGNVEARNGRNVIVVGGTDSTIGAIRDMYARGYFSGNLRSLQTLPATPAVDLALQEGLDTIIPGYMVVFLDSDGKAPANIERILSLYREIPNKLGLYVVGDPTEDELPYWQRADGVFPDANSLVESLKDMEKNGYTPLSPAIVAPVPEEKPNGLERIIRPHVPLLAAGGER